MIAEEVRYSASDIININGRRLVVYDEFTGRILSNSSCGFGREPSAFSQTICQGPECFEMAKVRGWRKSIFCSHQCYENHRLKEKNEKMIAAQERKKEAYERDHAPKVCRGCNITFIPSNQKRMFCTGSCASRTSLKERRLREKRDGVYFGWS